MNKIQVNQIYFILNYAISIVIVMYFKYNQDEYYLKFIPQTLSKFKSVSPNQINQFKLNFKELKINYQNVREKKLTYELWTPWLLISCKNLGTLSFNWSIVYNVTKITPKPFNLEKTRPKEDFDKWRARRGRIYHLVLFGKYHWSFASSFSMCKIAFEP